MTKSYEYVKCPLCKKNNYEIIIFPLANLKKLSKKNYIDIFTSSSSVFSDQVVQCKNCKFIYLNPRIKKNIIDKGYSYSKDKEFISQNENRIKTFNNTLSIINKKIDLRKKKILDIGSGGGAFLKACKDKKFNATGVEPNRWLVKYAKKKYGVNISTKNFSNIKKAYDVVCLFDVLEHIPNLHLTTKNISKLTRKDGYVVISVPDHDSLARKLLKRNWPFYLSVHLHYFNKNSIIKLFRSRFKLIYSKPYWQNLELGYVFERASKYFKIFKFLRNIIIFFNLDKISIKYNVGQTLFIFKKK